LRANRLGVAGTVGPEFAKSGTGMTDKSPATGAETDTAPLGIVPCRVVVGRHVLGPVARQGADQPSLTGEVVAAIVQVHAVAVTG